MNTKHLMALPSFKIINWILFILSMNNYMYDDNLLKKLCANKRNLLKIKTYTFFKLQNMI